MSKLSQKISLLSLVLFAITACGTPGPLYQTKKVDKVEDNAPAKSKKAQSQE